MRFKNLTCLKKVWNGQAQTKLEEDSINFNDSVVSLDGNKLSVNIKDSEVLFLANSNKVRKEVSRGKRPEYDITINWVELYTAEEAEKELLEDETKLVMITKSVYDVLIERFETYEAVYAEILSVGISQISVDLVGLKDFCAVTCVIIE